MCVMRCVSAVALRAVAAREWGRRPWWAAGWWSHSPEQDEGLWRVHCTSLHRVDRRVVCLLDESGDESAGAVADRAADARPAGAVVVHGAVEVELVPPPGRGGVQSTRTTRRQAAAWRCTGGGRHCVEIVAGNWRRRWIAVIAKTGTANDAMLRINELVRALVYECGVFERAPRVYYSSSLRLISTQIVLYTIGAVSYCTEPRIRLLTTVAARKAQPIKCTLFMLKRAEADMIWPFEDLPWLSFLNSLCLFFFLELFIICTSTLGSVW